MYEASLESTESLSHPVITQDSFRESIAKQGNLLHYESSDQFARTVRDEYQRNKTILAP